jgi:predicted nucleic acid-binding protein
MANCSTPLGNVSERLLSKMSAMLRALPAVAYLRAGDAIHLTTAADAGEREVWSNDRHLLAAAQHFGLIGRSA